MHYPVHPLWVGARGPRSRPSWPRPSRTPTSTRSCSAPRISGRAWCAVTCTSPACPGAPGVPCNAGGSARSPPSRCSWPWARRRRWRDIPVDGTPHPNAITAANSDTPPAAARQALLTAGPTPLSTGAGSTHTLTGVNNTTPYGATGLPVVSTSITTTATTIAGMETFRSSPSTARNLNETTVSGGVRGGGKLPGGRGGGVYNRGNLTLTRSTVSGNSAGFRRRRVQLLRHRDPHQQHRLRQ